jgi:hypothetical protein
VHKRQLYLIMDLKYIKEHLFAYRQLKYILPKFFNDAILIKWFELMKNEQNRLLTFVNEWDSSIITADKMAKAGFFFLHSDHVVCAYCRGEIYNWSKTYNWTTQK